MLWSKRPGRREARNAARAMLEADARERQKHDAVIATERRTYKHGDSSRIVFATSTFSGPSLRGCYRFRVVVTREEPGRNHVCAAPR